MTEKTEQNLGKLAIEAELALARLGYAYYRKAQIEKFKSVLNSEELASLQKESKEDFCRQGC